MPLYIPGTDDLFEAGLDNLIQALLNRNAVVAGCQVVERAPQIMGIRVNAGTIQGTAIRVAVAQTDLAVTIGGATPRVDLVSTNFTTGVPHITAGTPAAVPKPPALPATDILNAYISVGVGAVIVTQSNISDRRLFLPAYEDVLALAAMTTNPNLVLNSDFGRRSSIGLAMPENFADLTAWTAQSGTLGTVAANVLTPGTTGAWRAKWNGPTDMWRDGRWVAIFKATTTGEQRAVEKYVDANNMVRALYNGSNLELTKIIAGVTTAVANSSALGLTLNNWYCLELYCQGTMYIATIWDLGAASAPRPNAAATRQVTGTIADAAVTAGGLAIFENNTTVSLWGGQAASPGGVFVETWMPDSWTIQFNVGTQFGGLAFGYDEAADSGPLTKQWAARVYVPSTSRTMLLQQSPLAPDNMALPSVSYAASMYQKTSGKGGAGALITGLARTMDLAQGNIATIVQMDDAGEVVWTRKTGTGVSAATAKLKISQIYVNLPATATGQAFFSLFQYEQHSAVTSWRPAPADDEPIMFKVNSTGLGVSTTSAAYVEIDPRDLAANIFLPWDAIVRIEGHMSVNNTGANLNRGQAFVDGSSVGFLGGDSSYMTIHVANLYSPMPHYASASLAAGKHRVALKWQTAAGTLSSTGGLAPSLTITAYRGK